MARRWRALAKAVFRLAAADRASDHDGPYDRDRAGPRFAARLPVALVRCRRASKSAPHLLLRSIGAVARVERQRNPGRRCRIERAVPDFAALNPGYACSMRISLRYP